MKKAFLAALLMAAPAYADMSRDCVAGAVSVSTTTPTALPTSAIAGRYRIDLINTSNAYHVAVGTHSAVSYANGFLVTHTSSGAARATLYVPSGIVLYALGESNAVAGTINVRYFECK